MRSQRDLVGRLFSETHEALRRYVRRLVASRDTADEIVQEAFLRTYQNSDRLETPRAFLFTIARNLAADARRSRDARRTETLGDLGSLGVVSGEESPEGQALADEESQLLKEAILRLSPQCRAAFSLKVFHGCSYREIAERLKIAPKTVENHIARALRETVEYLGKRTR